MELPIPSRHPRTEIRGRSATSKDARHMSEVRRRRSSVQELPKTRQATRLVPAGEAATAEEEATEESNEEADWYECDAAAKGKAKGKGKGKGKAKGKKE
eukprot:4881076-Amphidinium_carterae.1